jgi:hypothetical protein
MVSWNFMKFELWATFAKSTCCYTSLLTSLHNLSRGFICLFKEVVLS